MQLLEHFVYNTNMPDIKKARIAELVAAADFQLLSGGNEELNLLNVLSSIAQTITAANLK